MIMNKPKTITQLSKEQLEDMCINLMHVDNEKANIIEELENRINNTIKCIKVLTQPTRGDNSFHTNPIYILEMCTLLNTLKGDNDDK